MKELLALIQVKKIIALVLTFVFAFLAIIGTVDIQNFMTVFLLVIGAYFGQSIAKEAKKTDQ